MTSKDKDLVEELLTRAHQSNVDVTDRAAARIEALSAENERLRYELRCIFNDYQGYMADEWIASVRAALGETE